MIIRRGRKNLPSLLSLNGKRTESDKRFFFHIRNMLEYMHRGIQMHRLYYMLLGVLDKETSDSVDYIIALHILRYMKVLDGVSIQDLADSCMVSKSTISRFCRKIGLEDYSDLMEEIHAANHPVRGDYVVPAYEGTPDEYLRETEKAVSSLRESLDEKKIERIAYEIANHETVYVMGSMQAYNPAASLQADLAMYEKIVFAPSVFTHQARAIHQAGPEDLIIIFSNSGNFLDRILMNDHDRNSLKDPQIWMITGNEKVHPDEIINEVITVAGNHTYMDHPLKFDLIAHLITISYGKYLKNL